MEIPCPLTSLQHSDQKSTVSFQLFGGSLLTGLRILRAVCLFVCLYFCFKAFSLLCSQVSFCCYSGVHLWCWGLSMGWVCARQSLYPVFYDSSSHLSGFESRFILYINIFPKDYYIHMLWQVILLNNHRIIGIIGLIINSFNNISYH